MARARSRSSSRSTSKKAIAATVDAPPTPRASHDTKFNYPSSYEKSEPLSTPHTVSVLFVIIAFIGYAIFSSDEVASDTATSVTNATRGALVAIALGLVYFSQYSRDTLFVRPHPALWRAATGVGFFYMVFLTFMLFQNVADARRFMLYLDPQLTGEPLPHRSYGESCDLTWPNLSDALFDIFTVAHLLGWVFKALMIRDFWISQAVSVLFELMEYTFVYIQPNFAECWWDHWLLDFMICNMLGILVAHGLIWAFEFKEYNWAGVGVAGVRGKIARVLDQFTPMHWTHYSWKVFADARRFVLVSFVIVATMIVELDAFFLKDILWVPPSSKLNVYRLIVWWLICMPGLRDYYAFVSDSSVARIGPTCWIMLASCILELLLVLKWGYYHHYAGVSPPPVVVYVWLFALTTGGIAIAWWFGYELPKRKAADSSSGGGSSKRK